MEHRDVLSPTGIVLVGTHPRNNSAFDRLEPRPLLPVAHRPLISYALSWLRNGGIRDVAVCANRETRALQSRLLRQVPDGMILSYQEDPMPRGAAGSLRDARSASDADTFVVADGTAIPTVGLEDLLSFHRRSRAVLTIVAHSEPSRNGNPSLQVPSGTYVFSREALDGVPERGFYDIKEHLIPQLYRSGQPVVVYATVSASPRVLDASSYLAVSEWIVEQHVTSGEHSEGYVKSGDCLFHKDAQIADDAVFVGPVLVGPGARVMSRAVVVGPTWIGREATVGRGVLVSRSAVWRRSVVGEDVVADRCILADDTVVDAGSHVYGAVLAANQRHEPEIVRDPSPEIRHASSLRPIRRIEHILRGATWPPSPAAQ